MENKKEKTTPTVSVGADTEQLIQKNAENSISEYEENIKSFEEMPSQTHECAPQPHHILNSKIIKT